MTGDWRDRLEAARKASGKSKRAVSIEADCAPGYYHGMITGKQEPGLERLMRIASVLNVSLPFLLYGMEIGPRQERLLRHFEQLDERGQVAFLDFLAARGAR